jgi:hypothetical protein
LTEELSTLICSPSPRDIKQVSDSVNAIKGVPKLWAKYYHEADAYRIMERYFLEHTNADYLVICPDDLVARDEDYRAILKTINDHGGKEQFPMISGICNLHNMPGYRTQLAICIDQEIHPNRRRRHYTWMDMRHQDWKEKGYDKMELLRVKFSGFALQFVRRDIVERFGLQGDKAFNDFDKRQQDLSYDVMLCYVCNQNDIPIYVNPQVWMLHLRGSHPREIEGIEPLLVGVKEAKVLYVDGEGKESDITQLCEQYVPQKPIIREKKA